MALDYYDCYCLKYPSPTISEVTHTTECPDHLSFYGHTYTTSSNCTYNTQNCLDNKSMYTVVMDDVFQCFLLEDQLTSRTCSTLRTPRDRSYGYTHSICCYKQISSSRDRNLKSRRETMDIQSNTESFSETLNSLLTSASQVNLDDNGDNTAASDNPIHALLDSVLGKDAGKQRQQTQTKKKLLEFFATDGDEKSKQTANLDTALELLKKLEKALTNVAAEATKTTIEGNKVGLHNAKTQPSKLPDVETTTSAKTNSLDGPVRKSYSTEYLCGKNAPCCSRNLESIRSNLSLADFRGLACQTNKTLNFYLLDETRYKYLLENAGVDTSQPSLLVVDLSEKTHFSIKENLNYLSVGKVE